MPPAEVPNIATQASKSQGHLPAQSAAARSSGPVRQGGSSTISEEPRGASASLAGMIPNLRPGRTLLSDIATEIQIEAPELSKMISMDEGRVTNEGQELLAGLEPRQRSQFDAFLVATRRFVERSPYPDYESWEKDQIKARSALDKREQNVVTFAASTQSQPARDHDTGRRAAQIESESARPQDVHDSRTRSHAGESSSAAVGLSSGTQMHDPSPGSSSVRDTSLASSSTASRPIKLEPIDHTPAVRVPVLVETQLDQARTAFYEEVAQVCDLTGEAPQWGPKLDRSGGVIVHHRMQPVPENDDKFPLRDPNDPSRVHPRYAADDGSRCHSDVRLIKIEVAGKKMPEFLREMSAKDSRLRLDPSQIETTVAALTDDARQEFERLISERIAAPRSRPMLLSAADVEDHEQALIGQYGLFVPRPSDRSEYLTLSNGRILGFYTGALLENKHQREQAKATHPDSDHYGMDVNRLPQAKRRGSTHWSRSRKRTPVTYSALGFANSLAFANTALRRPDPDHPSPAYDHERINALFVPFDVVLTDKRGQPRKETVVALAALDNLFPEVDDRPHAQVLADYGDAYLANFSAPARSHADAVEVKPELDEQEDAIKRARHQFVNRPATAQTQFMEAKMRLMRISEGGKDRKTTQG
jgi:hypothetical protein